MKVYCVFELQSDPEDNLFFEMHGVAASIASARGIVVKQEKERKCAKYVKKRLLDKPNSSHVQADKKRYYHKWIPAHTDMNADNHYCTVVSRYELGSKWPEYKWIEPDYRDRRRWTAAKEGYIIEEMDVIE